jgi:hypothetical protein
MKFWLGMALLSASVLSILLDVVFLALSSNIMAVLATGGAVTLIAGVPGLLLVKSALPRMTGGESRPPEPVVRPMDMADPLLGVAGGKAVVVHRTEFFAGDKWPGALKGWMSEGDSVDVLSVYTLWVHVKAESGEEGLVSRGSVAPARPGEM